MSINLLNTVDQRSKYSVYGWIRHMQKTFKIGNVPPLVTAICILYFREDEIFNVISNGIKLSENKKMITKTEDDWDFANNSYGIMEIESENELEYIWDLKICSMQNTGGCAIGIASKQVPNEEIASSDTDYFYLFFSEGCQHHEDRNDKDYGIQWNDGDQISLEVDLKQGNISLSINNEDQGIAFHNIERSKDINYRLFVSLYCIGDCFEITKFSKNRFFIP